MPWNRTPNQEFLRRTWPGIILAALLIFFGTCANWSERPELTVYEWIMLGSAEAFLEGLACFVLSLLILLFSKPTEPLVGDLDRDPIPVYFAITCGMMTIIPFMTFTLAGMFRSPWLLPPWPWF